MSDAEKPYDSKEDTLKHIGRVQDLVAHAERLLNSQAVRHDRSKLFDPEKGVFDRMTPLLKELKYGTPEYELALVDLGPALENHYAHNRHHPEHHEDGILGMDLLDLIEMLCDWKASTERMQAGTGNILKSIRYNRARFGYSSDTERIFINTAIRLGWYDGTADEALRELDS